MEQVLSHTPLSLGVTISDQAHDLVAIDYWGASFGIWALVEVKEEGKTIWWENKNTSEFGSET